MWTVSNTSYVLTQVNVDGSPGRKFEVYDVPWFKPSVQIDTVVGRGVRQQYVLPLSYVEPATIDATGLIWLVGFSRSSAARNAEISRRLEVFDPRVGQVLASQLLAIDNLGFISGSDLGYSLNTNSDGAVSLTIYRLQLVRS